MLPTVLGPILGPEKAGRIAPAVEGALKKMRAGDYQDTKADLLRAIADAGASRQQISGMVGMLNHPLASGLLDRFSPGLAEGLKNIGTEICGTNSGPAESGRANYLPLNKE